MTQFQDVTVAALITFHVEFLQSYDPVRPLPETPQEVGHELGDGVGIRTDKCVLVSADWYQAETLALTPTSPITQGQHRSIRLGCFHVTDLLW